MIQFTQKYKDINDTLYWLIEQSKAHLPYAMSLPSFDTPQELFETFKFWTKYENDPRDRELIQGLHTLLEENYHGWPGLGDCDCFTCGLISLCWANGFNDLYIVLAGRNPRTPSHIYLMIDHDGESYVMDATEPYFDSERYYPFKQRLKIF